MPPETLDSIESLPGRIIMAPSCPEAIWNTDSPMRLESLLPSERFFLIRRVDAARSNIFLISGWKTMISAIRAILLTWVNI